ncbi:MAG: hypothetical protein RL632_2010, partial [Bacteroidota bacterium]
MKVVTFVGKYNVVMCELSFIL